MEFFDKGMGFSWRACRSFGSGFTYANSVMGPFTGTAGKTTPFVAYDEKGITYLATTNAGWLPYLASEGLRYVHYSTHKVRRQFGLDQDVSDDFTLVLDSITSVHPFPHPHAFKH